MRKYIKKLQSKEEHVRKQILLGSLIVSMTVVGSVWIYGLTDRYGEKSEATLAENTKESVKPFTIFKNSITNAYENISASVNKASFLKKEVEKKQIDLIVVDSRAE